VSVSEYLCLSVCVSLCVCICVCVGSGVCIRCVCGIYVYVCVMCMLCVWYFCIHFVPGFLGKLARRKEGHVDQVDGEGFRRFRLTLNDNRLSRYIQVKLVPTLHRPQVSLFSHAYMTLSDHF